MRKKLCDVCKKNPAKYLTRETKESVHLFICEECSKKYLKWGIVSLHGRD